MVRRTTAKNELSLVMAALACCAAPVFAEPPPPPRSDGLPERPDLQVEVNDESPRVRTLRPGDVLRSRLALRIPGLAELPPDHDETLDYVTLRELPPGSVYTEYRGLQGFIARRLQSRYRSLWRDQIDLLWDETNMTDAQRAAATQEMYLAFADLKCGRWWERSWRDSLPPEKGGAPATPWVHRVGETIDVVRVGAFRFTNELKLKIDGVAILDLDADPGLIFRPRDEIEDPERAARDHARLQRALIDPDEDGRRRPTVDGGAVGRLPGLAPIVAFELAPAQPIFWEGVSWKFKVRPAVSARVPSDLQPLGFLRALSLRFGIDMFVGRKKPTQVMGIDFACTYSPDREGFDIRGELMLLNW